MKTPWQFALFAFILLPLAYLAWIWPGVPEIVPTHIGTSGPDAWGHKSTLWIPTGVLAAASAFVYFLLRYISRIDPKRADKPQSPVFAKLGMGLAIFFTTLNFVLIKMMAEGQHLDKAVFVLMGALFMFMGNTMHSIKPNYFAGIRLPWTLASDYNWKMTHQLGGKIWFAGGLIFTIVALVTPMRWLPFCMPVFIITMVLIPVVYSYRLYTQEQTKSRQE
jgi:uncharacterized membrane protein